VPAPATVADFSAPEPDILGEPYVSRTVPLSTTDGGHAPGVRDIATVVSRPDAGGRTRAVVYLHGYIDSFFHPVHEAAWHEAGWDYLALEMRRSGRSLRPGQVRDDIRILAVRNEEIHLAIDLARERGAEQVVLLGHSTGGLQAALFAHDHPGAVDGVILNSPWLDLGMGWFADTVASPIVDKLGVIAPHLTVATLGGTYGEWLSNPLHGGHRIPEHLKPTDTQPVYASFLRAVRRAQRVVQSGRSTIDVPVLLAMSRRSGSRISPGPADLSGSDVVLDVGMMRRSAGLLGDEVTVLEVPGGVHDLALSNPDVAEFYTSEIIAWADGLGA
jgi:alpha-beta hydrolase superfamily lysophospholipase